MQKLPVVFIGIGVVIGILALVVGFQVFPSMLKKKISEQGGRLVNGTDKWESWRVVPIPVFQQLYVFNVTNPSEVKKGAKPILQELGPYIYQQKREKVDIKVDEERDTIFYRHRDDYFFRPDMSTGSLDDPITVLNLPFLGMAAKSLKLSSTERYFVSEIMRDDFPDEDMYVELTVDQFLFGGYHVPFIQSLSEMKGEQLLPNNTFGLYYNKNGSESLKYEIYSGVKEPSKFGKVVTYDGLEEVKLWEDDACNKIRGHDGTTMAPFLTPDRDFWLFVPGLCRNMKFQYESDVNLMGIPAYRYAIPKNFLANPSKNPENECFCPKPEKNFEQCPKDGVWELQACRQGTPMVMSFPHFYMGSEYYQNQSIGLHPIQEKHEMRIVLEPTTAISLQVAIRVQMNFDFRPNKYYPKLKKIPEIMHPIFWMEQGVTIPEEKAQLMKDKLIKTQEIVRLGTWVGLGVGCIFILAAILIYICRANSGKKTNAYYPKKASIGKNTYETGGNGYIEPPTKKPDWINSENERYNKITSPPNTRMNPEEQPFLPQRNENIYQSPPVANGHAPVVRLPSTPGPAPVVVAVYPKISDLPQAQNTNPDVTIDRVPTPTTIRQKVQPPTVPASALGVPFPQTNEFSSTGSMNNALDEMNNTLQDIQDTISSYENLK